ncbi:hypothetical protein FQR65_LT20354 [Abscondita terminalis]|nr:hypothetical protein FQR65_LT20354 [Abscondita terminalis]
MTLSADSAAALTVRTQEILALVRAPGLDLAVAYMPRWRPAAPCTRAAFPGCAPRRPCHSTGPRRIAAWMRSLSTPDAAPASNSMSRQFGGLLAIQYEIGHHERTVPGSGSGQLRGTHDGDARRLAQRTSSSCAYVHRCAPSRWAPCARPRSACAGTMRHRCEYRVPIALEGVSHAPQDCGAIKPCSEADFIARRAAQRRLAGVGHDLAIAHAAARCGVQQRGPARVMHWEALRARRAGAGPAASIHRAAWGTSQAHALVE